MGGTLVLVIVVAVVVKKRSRREHFRTDIKNVTIEDGIKEDLKLRRSSRSKSYENALFNVGIEESVSGVHEQFRQVSDTSFKRGHAHSATNPSNSRISVTRDKNTNRVSVLFDELKSDESSNTIA